MTVLHFDQSRDSMASHDRLITFLLWGWVPIIFGKFEYWNFYPKYWIIDPKLGFLTRKLDFKPKVLDFLSDT